MARRSRYSDNPRKKDENMPMFAHIFIGVTMAGAVAACLGYGSLAYLSHRIEQKEEEKKEAIIRTGQQLIAFERQKQQNEINKKWVTISNQEKTCRINTMTNEKICGEH